MDLADWEYTYFSITLQYVSGDTQPSVILDTVWGLVPTAAGNHVTGKPKKSFTIKKEKFSK